MRIVSSPAETKRRVNLTLNAELVDAVRPFAPNLSATIERLLADYLSERQRSANEREQRIDAAIEACNDMLRRHGSLSDDYPSTL